MLRILTLLAAGVTLAAPASADEGFYFGGTLGNTTVDTEFDDVNFNFDEDDFSWSAFAGFQATENFAIEASYNRFGDFDASSTFDLTQTDIDATLRGYDIMAVLSVPAGPLRLYGKAGVVFWDAEVIAQILPPVGPGFQLRDSDDGNDIGFGGGLEIQLAEDLALRGELEWFDIEDTEQVWFASVGVTFRF